MKILITGSRKWTDVKTIEQAILLHKATCVVEGAAPGADLIAEGVCKRHQINYRGYPAKWTKLGKKAGPVRNTEMLHVEHIQMMPIDGGIDLCLAFPMQGSIGTVDMMEQAAHAGIPVLADTRYL